jgi:PhnB protein
MTSAETMEFTPFIYYYGRCEEALEAYSNALGGTYEVLGRNASSEEHRMAPDFVGKISAAIFRAPGIAFMASDGGSARTVDPEDGNISLALTVNGETKGEHTFNALAEGGKIKAPLHPAEWGGRFGIVHDRFGTEWLITIK